MSNAIEIEAKALVSEEDFAKFVNEFKGYPSYTQTNYYLDNDEGIMAKEGFALRIREKGEYYEMTLKTPLSQGLLEKNCTWDSKTFYDFTDKHIFPQGDIHRFLDMLEINPESLQIKAKLTTKRIDIPYLGGKLSLDENTYYDKKDYEIELEYNNIGDATRLLEELFDKLGVPFAISKKSKVRRAREEANRIGK